MSHKVSALVWVILSLTITSCGSSFEASRTGMSNSFQSTGQNDSESETGKDGLQDNTGDSSGAPASWKGLEISGSINGAVFNGVEAVKLDKTRKELIVRLPMPQNPLLEVGTMTFPIRDIPGAHLQLESDTQGSALTLRIPLTHVIRGAKLSSPDRLPNGDSLPNIPSGELPTTAVDLVPHKKIRASVYLAPSVVGLFINSPFDPTIGLSLPIRNASKTRVWGYFSAIPAKQDSVDGGFFISVSLPSDIARIIDDHI